MKPSKQNEKEVTDGTHPSERRQTDLRTETLTLVNQGEPVMMYVSEAEMRSENYWTMN